jgi:hypothetical protein
MARKLAFEDTTKYHNTQELMVNGLWALREAVCLSLLERMILLVGALTTDASRVVLRRPKQWR